MLRHPYWGAYLLCVLLVRVSLEGMLRLGGTTLVPAMVHTHTSTVGVLRPMASRSLHLYRLHCRLLYRLLYPLRSEQKIGSI